MYGSGQTEPLTVPIISPAKGVLGGKRVFSLKYDWEYDYVAAILEEDNARLPDRISYAELAMTNRLDVLKKDHGGTPEEVSALATALGVWRN